MCHVSEPIYAFKSRKTQKKEYAKLPLSTRVQRWAKRAFAGECEARKRGQTKFPATRIEASLFKHLNLQDQLVRFDEEGRLWGTNKQGVAIQLAQVEQRS